ncbi:hypothetical protein ISCGN_032207 [Ixodes scapularis]
MFPGIDTTVLRWLDEEVWARRALHHARVQETVRRRVLRPPQHVPMSQRTAGTVLSHLPPPVQAEARLGSRAVSSGSSRNGCPETHHAGRHSRFVPHV